MSASKREESDVFITHPVWPEIRLQSKNRALHQRVILWPDLADYELVKKLVSFSA